MSDVMLHGVLRMPPELWRDGPLDVSQRHSRYIEASERIEADAKEIERLRLALEEAKQKQRAEKMPHPPSAPAPVWVYPPCSTSADWVPPPTTGTCR